MTQRNVVPCDGCTVCCQNEQVFLHPENGDVPEAYQTQPAVNPMTQRPAIALAQKDNGDCFYLGDTGCTIWQRAPVACRKFDCRKLLKAIGGRPAQRRAIAAGFISQAHLDAAKAAIARSE